MKWNTKILLGISLLAALALAGCTVNQPAENPAADAAAGSSAPASDSSAAVGATGDILSKGDLTMTLPDGWTIPDDPSVIYSPNYPDDTSNINVQEADKNPGFSLLTQQVLQQTYDQMLTQAMGTDVKTTIDNFDKIKVGDYDAMKIKLHYSVKGLDITQMQILIDADSTYTVTYTQMGGADWMDAFDASAKTIAVSK